MDYFLHFITGEEL